MSFRFRQQVNATPLSGGKTFIALSRSLSAHAFSGQLTADWREAHQDKLAIEARERDAALKEAGAISLPPHNDSRRLKPSCEDRTDGIYAELNRSSVIFCARSSAWWEVFATHGISPPNC